MKKLYTILIALFALASLQTNAQFVCNASFTSTYLGQNIYKFQPADTVPQTVITILHNWNFGDGLATNIVAPTHTFLASGTYIVKHKVYKVGSPNTTIYCSDSTSQTITIPPTTTCNLQAAYTKTSLAGTILTQQFTNTSTNFAPGDSIRWTFGDGTTSYLPNPLHTFANAGIYNVCLWVKRPSTNASTPPCISEICKLDTVVAPTPACNLQAYYTNDSAINNTVHFTNQSIGYATGDSILWNFGDGSTSTDVNPTHIFANAGTYNVCVRVKKNNTTPGTLPCVSYFCKNIVVVAPCNLVANYTWYRDSFPTSPLYTIHFTNATFGYSSSDSVRWSFGDGTFSNLSNPSHIYAATGTYAVCLRIIKRTSAGLTNCVSEKCSTVVVTAPIVPCTLVANYTWYRDSFPTVVNYTVHFTNTSTSFSSIDSIRWSFGDGTYSNQVSPNHIYTTVGTYTVCLRIIKRGTNGILLTNCISEKCSVVIVTAPVVPCNFQVYFSQIVDSSASNIIHFTNQTVGYASGDSITWTFGDGTSSHDVNPVHIYTVAGTYTVCLTIKKNTTAAGTTPCVRQYCKTITVVLPCSLVANYTWYRDSLPTVALNTVHFTNTSTSLASTDSIRWSFGDGTYSNQVNPVHSYATYGVYTVCLKIIKRNPAGLTNCISEKCMVVTVPQVCNITATYTWHADSANYKNIIFTNTTVPPSPNATATWYFGDGANATTWNSSHVYAQAGRYYVCLRVQYGTCVSYKCDSVSVIAPTPIPPTCTQISNYTFVRSGNSVSFSPTFAATGVTYVWTFGDGTSALGANVTHIYATAGVFTACLTAYRNNNCGSTTCNSIQITTTSICGNITLGVNDVRDILVPNRITFSVVSNTATISQQWTITKIPTTATTGTVTINGNNPTYMFQDSGYYNVCVTATFAGGCVKTFCKIIHITQNLPGTNVCTLQTYPNPATNTVNTQVTLATPQMISASIYNSQNVLVSQTQHQGVVGVNTISINIANLASGTYILRVAYGNQICYASFVK